MNFISKEALQRIREQYPEGTRVELPKMSDPYRPTLFPVAGGQFGLLTIWAPST